MSSGLPCCASKKWRLSGQPVGHLGARHARQSRCGSGSTATYAITFRSHRIAIFRVHDDPQAQANEGASLAFAQDSASGGEALPEPATTGAGAHSVNPESIDSASSIPSPNIRSRPGQEKVARRWSSGALPADMANAVTPVWIRLKPALHSNDGADRRRFDQAAARLEGWWWWQFVCGSCNSRARTTPARRLRHRQARRLFPSPFPGQFARLAAIDSAEAGKAAATPCPI